MTVHKLKLAVAETDPIFDAIERHRIAEAAFAASEGDDHLTNNGKKSWKLYGALLATKPTTLAGCAAMLRYIEAHEASYDGGTFENCSEPVRSAGNSVLSRIATAIETI